ncbi:hypothetical protein BDR04DRAFT_675411 [Suillus decipiens]|nr:hypothetical protein BDR04DRAFT_675411 [Suillus decipiens]
MSSQQNVGLCTLSHLSPEQPLLLNSRQSTLSPIQTPCGSFETFHQVHQLLHPVWMVMNTCHITTAPPRRRRKTNGAAAAICRVGPVSALLSAPSSSTIVPTNELPIAGASTMAAPTGSSSIISEPVVHSTLETTEERFHKELELDRKDAECGFSRYEDAGILLETAERTADIVRFWEVIFLSAIHKINGYHVSKKNVHFRYYSASLWAMVSAGRVLVPSCETSRASHWTTVRITPNSFPNRGDVQIVSIR